MSTSSNSVERTSCPPSGPAAACPCSTRIAPGLSEFSSTEVIGVLLALLDGLSSNVLSGDVWALSILQAQARAREFGVADEAFAAIMQRVIAAQQQNRRGNPMAAMF